VATVKESRLFSLTHNTRHFHRLITQHSQLSLTHSLTHTHIHTYTHTNTHTHTHLHTHNLSYQSRLVKSHSLIGLFLQICHELYNSLPSCFALLRNTTYKIRHSVGLGNPIAPHAESLPPCMSSALNPTARASHTQY